MSEKTNRNRKKLDHGIHSGSSSSQGRGGADAPRGGGQEDEDARIQKTASGSGVRGMEWIHGSSSSTIIQGRDVEGLPHNGGEHEDEAAGIQKTAFG